MDRELSLPRGVAQRSEDIERQLEWGAAVLREAREMRERARKTRRHARNTVECVAAAQGRVVVVWF